MCLFLLQSATQIPLQIYLFSQRYIGLEDKIPLVIFTKVEVSQFQLISLLYMQISHSYSHWFWNYIISSFLARARMFLINVSLCAFSVAEKLIISAPEDFRLEWLPAPRNRAGLVFEARSARNALFVLSDGRYANERSYQVMLGDTTWIGRGSHGKLYVSAVFTK